MTTYEEQLEEMVNEMRTLLGTALMDHRGIADYWRKDTRKALDRSTRLLITHAITARVTNTEPSDGEGVGI